MKKTCFSLLCSILLLVSLTACGGQEDAPPPEPEAETGTIQLTVWGAEEDLELLEELAASFQAHYAGQASFRITVKTQTGWGIFALVIIIAVAAGLYGIMKKYGRR